MTTRVNDGWDADAVRDAHSFLAASVSADPRDRREDPERPETIQAMQIALEIPKADPPARTDLLEAAARATVAVCLNPLAGTDPAWRERLAAWYGHRIRKIARRARNKAWRDAQELSGATVTNGAARARAFVPCAVSVVPSQLKKLQIKGTELPLDQPPAPEPTVPLILLNAGLEMSLGKAAAQSGHASMLYAASQPGEKMLDWARGGFPLRVRVVPQNDFEHAAQGTGAVRVIDAGFTEVAPGSTTAVAVPPREG